MRAQRHGCRPGPDPAVPAPARGARWPWLLCTFEMCLGLALLVTVLPVGTRPGMALFAPRAATGARIAAAAFFLVAAAALAELRGRRPDLGCGCFGDFSARPAGRRSDRPGGAAHRRRTDLRREPGPVPSRRGATGPLLFLGIVCAELALIAALSPEVSEALVRLGYTDPCELRQVPAERTLAALRRSRTWRRHAQAVTTEMPDRHVARAVLAVRRLPVPPGRGERGSGVRGPAGAAPSAGPGRRPAAGRGRGPRRITPPRARAGPEASRGYAVIYARLTASLESSIFGQTGHRFTAAGPHTVWARRNRPKCGTVNAIRPRSEL